MTRRNLAFFALFAVAAMIAVTLPRMWKDPDCPSGWGTPFGCLPGSTQPTPTPTPAPKPKPPAKGEIVPCGSADPWTC